MTGAIMDPRMMDLVWTDRYEYEMLLFKRPSCTEAQPSNAKIATPTATSVKVSTDKKSPGKVSSVSADGKSKMNCPFFCNMLL